VSDGAAILEKSKRKETENLLHSRTPGRCRERRCASKFMYKTNSWMHYGRRRLGEQIAVETGNNKVIKLQNQEDEEEEKEIIVVVVVVTTEKRKSLVRKQLNWRPRNRSSISGRRMSFSVLESVQTGSGNHLTCFLTGPMIPSQEVRHLGREPDSWPASNAEVKYVCPIRICLSMFTSLSTRKLYLYVSYVITACFLIHDISCVYNTT